MSSPGHEPRGQVVTGDHQVTDQMEEQRMASEQEILSGLAEIVNEETGLPTDSVLADKSFTDDLDIDSLSMMTIVVNAEEKFSVRIPDEDVKNLRTVGDAVAYISQAQG
jgi:acyl carrier protein